ncbi:hypothetical protein YC2023_079355 [Brassica napus]
MSLSDAFLHQGSRRPLSHGGSLRRRPNGESQSAAPPNRKIDRSRGMMKGLRDDEETRE